MCLMSIIDKCDLILNTIPTMVETASYLILQDRAHWCVRIRIKDLQISTKTVPCSRMGKSMKYELGDKLQMYRFDNSCVLRFDLAVWAREIITVETRRYRVRSFRNRCVPVCGYRAGNFVLGLAQL